MERRQALIVVGTFAYMLVLGLMMEASDYNIWGAFVLLPAIALLSFPLLQWAFSGDLRRFRRIAVYGLIAKIGGACLRYWVAYDAYGGATDAIDYHNYGAKFSGSFLDTIPMHTGTQFLRELTAFIYGIIGSSQLAGFLVFAGMGYWGVVLFLKAAVVAVPRLATRRYALLLFFSPSLLYWPSAIGKEAWMMLSLGLATYGVAVLTTEAWRWRTVVLTTVGFVAAAEVRPHFATMWLGAFVVALVARSFATSPRRWRRPLASLSLIVVAVIGLVATLFLTLGYLDPNADTAADKPVTERITAIFDDTERRTSKDNADFAAMKVHSPIDVPGAVLRTLTRPLPEEATTLAQMLPALETMVLLFYMLRNWRRLATFHRLMRYAPFLTIVPVLAFEFGLAFTKVGNLGILTRQRSLMLPILLLVLCVPVWPKRQPLPLQPERDDSIDAFADRRHG